MGVAFAVEQHVSSMHLPSNQWVGLLMLVSKVVKTWKCFSQQKYVAEKMNKKEL